MALTAQFEVPATSETGIDFTNTEPSTVAYTFSASGTWTIPNFGECTAEGFPSLNTYTQAWIKENWPDFEKQMKYPGQTPYSLVAQNKTTGAVTQVGKKATIVLKPGETLSFKLNNATWDYPKSTGTIKVDASGTSVVPKVMQFDGNGDFVDIPPESLPTGNLITVSFWAKGANELPKNTSVIYAELSGYVLNIHLPWSDGVIYFDCGSGNGVYDRIAKGAEAIDYKNQWVHWAFTKNASTGEMIIYLNGQRWHSGTGCTKPVAKPAKVRIGSQTTNPYYYHGSLAEVAFWNKVLTQREIQVGMFKRLTGKEPNLVSYWPLNEFRVDGATPKVIDRVNQLQGVITGVVLAEDPSFPID
ncbi:MAG: LamG domain-containing protein [Oscillatoria princeps RMCB-10]|jgi:hypothetical protein|nr:LamG domain-containing protein [Oscillatoria princeps RMCB-10]